MKSSDLATARHVFPIRALVLGVVLTALLVILGGGLVWRLYARSQGFLTTELRIRTLAGEILRLDEVLTMSARMAAATGDGKWELRYLENVPALDADIKEMIALAPETYIGDFAAATSAANDVLVAMEQRSFDLLRAGLREEAARVFFSPQYEENKRAYAEGMARSNLSLLRRADDLLREQSVQTRVAAGVALAILIILGVAWTRISAILVAHIRATVAQSALAGANRELDQRVRERTAELSATNIQLSESLEKLATMQRQLMEASRKAGMADVASGVLHNVGNVLNSVNVSSNLVLETVKQSKLQGLTLTSTFLREHAAALGTAIGVAKAERLPQYLDKLCEQLEADRRLVLDELTSLHKNIDHIKVIVSKQQSHAVAVAVTELLDVAELIEDALRFESSLDSREGISIVCDLAELPIVYADRHKLMQVVVNLLANARHAVRNHDLGTRTITVRSRMVDDRRFSIEVADSGYGIAGENLARLFTHGFTTKKDGHGFGLHSSAVQLQEMGGSLRAASEGPGLGARFTLELPLLPPDEMAPRKGSSVTDEALSAQATRAGACR